MGLESSSLYQCMAFALMKVGVGGDEEIMLEASSRGETMRVRTKTPSGEVGISAVGESYDELGEQFALACLHHLSIERLRAFHETPLKEAPPTVQRVK